MSPQRRRNAPTESAASAPSKLQQPKDDSTAKPAPAPIPPTAPREAAKGSFSRGGAGKLLAGHPPRSGAPSRTPSSPPHVLTTANPSPAMPGFAPGGLTSADIAALVATSSRSFSHNSAHDVSYRRDGDDELDIGSVNVAAEGGTGASGASLMIRPLTRKGTLTRMNETAAVEELQAPGSAGPEATGAALLIKPLTRKGTLTRVNETSAVEELEPPKPGGDSGALLIKPLTRKGTLTRLNASLTVTELPEDEQRPVASSRADQAPSLADTARSNASLLIKPLTRKGTVNRDTELVAEADDGEDDGDDLHNATWRSSVVEGDFNDTVRTTGSADGAPTNADAPAAVMVRALNRSGTFRNADPRELNPSPSPQPTSQTDTLANSGATSNAAVTPVTAAPPPSQAATAPPVRNKFGSDASLSSLSMNAHGAAPRSPAGGGDGPCLVLNTTGGINNSGNLSSGGTPEGALSSNKSQSFSKKAGGFFGVVQEAQEAALKKRRDGTLAPSRTEANLEASVANWMQGVLQSDSMTETPAALANDVSLSLADFDDTAFSVIRMMLCSAGNSVNASRCFAVRENTVRVLPQGFQFSLKRPAIRFGDINDLKKSSFTSQSLSAASVNAATQQPSSQPSGGTSALSISFMYPSTGVGAQTTQPSADSGSPTHSATAAGTSVEQCELVIEGAVDVINALHSTLSLCLFKASQVMSRSLRSKRVLTIVHFNDVYNLNPPANSTTELIGGASRFHSILTAIRQVSNPLILFSGDFMGPSLMSVEMKGKQMIDAFNLIGVHFGCYGNHEFDYGKKALIDAVHGYTQGPFVYTGSTTTWVMSNMTEKDGTPLCGAKEYALTTWNGIRVGVLGLCENWLAGCSQLGPDDALYLDVFERGETLARKLKSEGAEIVIALTHCRIENDKRISAKCPTIDLILGGHDHFYKNLVQRRIVKSGEEFQFLTEIRVDLTAPATGTPPSSSLVVHPGLDPLEGHLNPFEALGAGGAAGHGDSVSNPDSEDASVPIRFQTQIRTHLVTRSVPKSAQMDRMIRRYDAKLNERMGGVIGRTAVELDPTESACRFHEGVLTGFVADVMAAQLRADLAVIGGAAISGKVKLPAGPITLGDVFSWFPNDTRVMLVRMSGATLKKMLTVMVREMPGEAPSFPHCSANLQFTIDLFKRPPQVCDVRYKRQPLRDDEFYNVAVEDFAGKGSGKYKFVPVEGEVLVDDESAEQLVFWVIDFFRSKKGQAKDGNALLKHGASDVASAATGGDGSGVGGNGDGSNGDGVDTRRRRKSQHSKAGRGGDSGGANSRRSLTAAAPNNNVYPVSKFRSLEFSASLDSETLARVYAATSLLTDDVESGSNMTLITRVIMKLLKCEMVRVYLFDENSQQLRLVTAPIHEQSATRLSLDSGTIAGECVAERAAINITHPRDPLFHARVDDIAPGVENAPHVMSMLSIPVTFKKKVLGVVQAINKIQSRDLMEDSAIGGGRRNRHGRGAGRRNADDDDLYGGSRSSSGRSGSDEDDEGFGALEVFTNVDIGVALLLARQIGIQLHFSAIFSRMRRSEKARDSLLEMAVRLGRAEKDSTVKGMVLKIVNVATAMLNCDRASLFLVDKGDLWTVVPSKDFTTEITIRLPRGTGVVGHVVEQGEMMNVHDAYLCKYFNPEVDRRTGYQTRTILALPLFAANQENIIGVLQLINKKDGTVFDSQDEELANNFCQLAAVAVHNSFEMETLRVGRDDSSLQTLPVHDLTRIKIRGGWLTCRRSLQKIISPEFKKRIHLTPIVAGSDHSGAAVGGGHATADGGNRVRSANRERGGSGDRISNALHEFEQEFASLVGSDSTNQRGDEEAALSVSGTSTTTTQA